MKPKFIITSKNDLEFFYNKYLNNPKEFFSKHKDLKQWFHKWLMIQYHISYSWWEQAYKKYLKELAKVFLKDYYNSLHHQIEFEWYLKNSKIRNGLLAIALYNHFLINYLCSCYFGALDNEGDKQ